MKISESGVALATQFRCHPLPALAEEGALANEVRLICELAERAIFTGGFAKSETHRCIITVSCSSEWPPVHMHIGTRPVTRDDFNHMVRLCQPEPFREIPRLRREWDVLWKSGTFMGVVLEDADLPPDQRALAMLGTVFVADEFFDHAKASAAPYVVRRMVEYALAGRAAILSEDDLAVKNATDGLVLYVTYLAWQALGHGTVRAETLRSFLVNSYADRFQGNNVRWIVGETAGTYIRTVALRTGCEIINDYPEWEEPAALQGQDLRPCLVGVNRDGGMTIENYWFHRMFTYMTPRFGFTDSQRQVLLLARDGLTDVEVAADLQISTDAVKKRWVGIYDRVDSVLPGLLPESPPGGRGAEKRRALLMHLRDCPEELRPFARATFQSANSRAG